MLSRPAPDLQPAAPSVPTEMGPPATWPTGTLLAAAGRLIEQEWNRQLQDLGVTASTIGVLLALGDRSMSQAELATAAQMSPQSMGRSLTRLERRGFVARDRDKTDHRRTNVRATSQGLRTLDQALHGHRRGISVFDHLADPAQFRRDLLCLIDQLAPPPADDDPEAV